jgi:hypothetical protein
MSREGIKSLESSVPTPSAEGVNHLDGVLQVVYESISYLNDQLPQEQRILPSLSTVLFGAGGKLDSLGLANFIVIAEQKLEDDPFSPTTGHFRTVHSLATYVAELAAQRSGRAVQQSQ